MAIFGKQGLQAAALYLAVIWATYGQSRAGWKDKAEMENITLILDRKASSLKDKKGAKYKEAAQALRKSRYDAIVAMGVARTGKTGGERYKSLAEKTSEFRTEFEKQSYLR